MPRVGWPLQRGRPCIQIVLRLGPAGQPSERILLADTGAGALSAAFDLLLEEDDCLLFGGLAGSSITLGGAYRGSFPVYYVPVQIPAIGFSNLNCAPRT